MVKKSCCTTHKITKPVFIYSVLRIISEILKMFTSMSLFHSISIIYHINVVKPAVLEKNNKKYVV